MSLSVHRTLTIGWSGLVALGFIAGAIAMFLSLRAPQSSSTANVGDDERRVDSPQLVSEAHG